MSSSPFVFDTTSLLKSEPLIEKRLRKKVIHKTTLSRQISNINLKSNVRKLVSFADDENLNDSLLYSLTYSNNKKWVCIELIEKRFNVTRKEFEESLIEENITSEQLDLILYYAYGDEVNPDAKVNDLLRVYYWALIHAECDRFKALLFNLLRQKINGTNVVEIYFECDRLNGVGDFQTLVSHCKWFMHLRLVQGRQSQVKDILSHPNLLVVLFSSEFRECTFIDVPDSTFSADVLSLYDDNLGTVTCAVSSFGFGNVWKKAVPAILAVNCQYFWNLFCGQWEKTSTLNLSEIGLSEDEIKAAKFIELDARGKIMEKIIRYWHGASVSVESNEYMDMIDLFKFLGFDSQSDSLYSYCLNRVVKDLSIDTVLPICARFINDGDLIQNQLSETDSEIVHFLAKNWVQINQKYSMEEINQYCSKHLLQRIITKLVLEYNNLMF
jgi:hypothetical protein